jgi:hypothetical protein
MHSFASETSPALDCTDCCGTGVRVYRSFDERCDACDGRGVALPLAA